MSLPQEKITAIGQKINRLKDAPLFPRIEPFLDILRVIYKAKRREQALHRRVAPLIPLMREVWKNAPNAICPPAQRRPGRPRRYLP
ncbi:MAG: hypothetical protein LBF93_02420 [Zoogloeaceae bacterium]|jgi:hypothetical protein|nr:hypothetical protein [Zoogloeaceae bacterium]